MARHQNAQTYVEFWMRSSVDERQTKVQLSRPYFILAYVLKKACILISIHLAPAEPLRECLALVSIESRPTLRQKDRQGSDRI